MTRAEYWELVELPGAEDAAATLDHALADSVGVMERELRESVGRLEAFRVAFSILWFALLLQDRFGSFDTVVRENAWERLLAAAAPVLCYQDPHVLEDDLESWGRLHP